MNLKAPPENTRGQLQSLLDEANSLVSQLTHINKLVERKERAKIRLGQPRTHERALHVYEARRDRINAFYAKFRQLRADALKTLQQAGFADAAADLGPPALMHVELLAKVLLNAVSHLKAASHLDPVAVELKPQREIESRETRIQEFKRKHGTTLAAIARSASVHKPDLRKWRFGPMKDDSVMAQRIEQVLSGDLPLLSASED